MCCILLNIFIIALLSFSKGSSLVHNETLERDNNKQHLITTDGKLIAAHVLFRHSERNVNKVYPNDPYKDEIFWPGGFGQLTLNGKKQHYKLGQYFRKRYDGIIGKQYSRNDVYIQSTDIDRTLMSAQANLAGLFPPSTEELFEDSILWHPIPVHTVPLDQDYVLFGPQNCPKFDVLYNKYVSQSPEVHAIYTECEKLYSYLSEMSGMNISSIDDVFRLHDVLYIEDQLKMTLPDWAYDIINPNGTMRKIVTFYFKIQSSTTQMARLKMGFLVKEMIQHFMKKINFKLVPNRSLFLYSAHDFTIANFLNALGLFEQHIPPFAASVHFELYKTEDNKHYVQLLYKKGEEEMEPVPLFIPKCGLKCALDQFIAIYNDIIPGDHDIECRPDQTKAEIDHNLEDIY